MTENKVIDRERRDDFMAEKDAQWGIIMVIVAAIFLIAGLGLLDYDFLDEKFSTLIAFVLVAVGVYLIAKK